MGISNADKVQKKIELIAQLLAKAESTTTEEAEALTEHAERLMVQYMIDQATIDERRAKQGQDSEKIVREGIHFTGAYRGEMLHLSHMVTVGLGSLRMLQSTTWSNGKEFVAYIVGFESDVAQAKTLIASLQVQAMVAVRAWWKENKDVYAHLSSYDQEKQRRSFVHGFGTGAGNRLIESRLKVVQEASTGTDLVLVSRKQRVDEHVDSRKTRNARARTATGNGAAAYHGIQAGKNANTGERQVSQGRGITA